ncbi:MAG: YraN family protein [Lachnospiraceae bacterium]|nr:YraN family protein [Lachnospiraceae bacterium]
MNRRQLGTDKEKLAAEYLEAQGMIILERNFRGRRGEIDLVGREGNYLVFVEVKYRSNTRMGAAMEAVDYRKQRQICRVADYYRYLHRLGSSTMIRYDVVAIQGEEIRWVRNAFPHMDAGR